MASSITEQKTTFTLTEIAAIVRNPQLDSTLWNFHESSIADIIRDRIVAAFKYASRGENYRGTLDVLKSLK